MTKTAMDKMLKRASKPRPAPSEPCFFGAAPQTCVLVEQCVPVMGFGTPIMPEGFITETGVRPSADPTFFPLVASTIY